MISFLGLVCAFQAQTLCWLRPCHHNYSHIYFEISFPFRNDDFRKSIEALDSILNEYDDILEDYDDPSPPVAPPAPPKVLPLDLQANAGTESIRKRMPPPTPDQAANLIASLFPGDRKSFPPPPPPLLDTGMFERFPNANFDWKV